MAWKTWFIHEICHYLIGFCFISLERWLAKPPFSQFLPNSSLQQFFSRTGVQDFIIFCFWGIAINSQLVIIPLFHHFGKGWEGSSPVLVNIFGKAWVISPVSVSRVFSIWPWFFLNNHYNFNQLQKSSIFLVEIALKILQLGFNIVNFKKRTVALSKKNKNVQQHTHKHLTGLLKSFNLKALELSGGGPFPFQTWVHHLFQEGVSANFFKRS